MQHTTLDSLARIRSGYPFRGPVKHDPTGDIRVLQIRDLRHPKKLDAEALSRISAPDNYSAHLLQPDDIVMPARGDHRAAVIFTLTEPTIASSHLHTVRVTSPDVLPRYLCWALNQSATQHAMESEARGTAMPLLSRRSLSAIQISLPSIATQKRIIELNDLWQREHALTLELLTNTGRLVEGMIQQLMSFEQAANPTQDGDPR